MLLIRQRRLVAVLGDGAKVGQRAARRRTGAPLELLAGVVGAGVKGGEEVPAEGAGLGGAAEEP
nr:unnamed protein product [Digitaria exilis]